MAMDGKNIYLIAFCQGIIPGTPTVSTTVINRGAVISDNFLEKQTLLCFNHPSAF